MSDELLNVNMTFSNSGSWCTQLKEWLAEITYRPGWEFQIQDFSGSAFITNGNGFAGRDGPGVYLLIHATTQDSNHYSTLHLVHTMIIYPGEYTERDAFLSAVLRRIVMVETHEAMEFFKVSGVRHRNPHPSEGAFREVLYSL